MAKYKKRKDGRYSAHVHLGYDENGKQVFSPMIYAYSIPELEKKKAEVKNAVDKGIYADDKGKTLGKYADEWLDTYKSNKANGTYSNYANIIKNHITEISELRLRDLTKSNIQRQVNLKASHPETQRMLKITINQILESAIEDGLIYKNVSRRVEKQKAQKSEKRALYDSEKKAIAKCEFNDSEKAFLYILLYCGLRRSEALALTKSDIDFTQNEININKSLEWLGNTPSIKSTKSDSSFRRVMMPNVLKETLKSYMGTLDAFQLFTNDTGQLMSESQYRKFWEGIYNKINGQLGGTPDKRTNSERIKGINAIPGLTPHTFRHNYATLLYYAGVDVKEAQRLLGHSSIKITLEIYTHLDNQKSNLNDKINSFKAL